MLTQPQDLPWETDVLDPAAPSQKTSLWSFILRNGAAVARRDNFWFNFGLTRIHFKQCFKTQISPKFTSLLCRLWREDQNTLLCVHIQNLQTRKTTSHTTIKREASFSVLHCRFYIILDSGDECISTLLLLENFALSITVDSTQLVYLNIYLNAHTKNKTAKKNKWEVPQGQNEITWVEYFQWTLYFRSDFSNTTKHIANKVLRSPK